MLMPIVTASFISFHETRPDDSKTKGMIRMSLLKIDFTNIDATALIADDAMSWTTSEHAQTQGFTSLRT